MKKKGFFLIFLTAVISGLSVFMNKFGINSINSDVFVFLKNTVVALILTGIIVMLKEWKFLRNNSCKQWALLVLIGLFGGSIPFLLFFRGLSMTSAVQGAFIHKTMFLYVAILAIVFLKERINKKFLLGAIFLLLGNLILLKKMEFSFGAGDALVFGATLFWAAENVISKYALRQLEARVVAWGRMFFGSVFILLFLALNGQLGQLTNLNFQQGSWVFFTSILLFAYVFSWYHGLKYVSVSAATSVLLLGLPITTALSLVSGAKFNTQELLAGFLIIIGAVLIARLEYFKEKTDVVKKKFYAGI